MTEPNRSDALAMPDEIETEISRVDVKALAVLNRSELEVQIDTAHRYRRSITRFLQEAQTLATMSQEIAESCIYSLPRKDETGRAKMITGPSVRLAEICASAYQNLHYGARVLGEEEKEIISQGAAYDLEKNVRVTVEVRRRITYKSGSRYSDDMVIVTGNAAASIALRNAIFRVIPRAYVDTVYNHARLTSIGDAQTLVARRDQFFARLAKAGVSKERVLARLAKTGMADVGLEDLEVLVGLGTAVKQGSMSLDEAFPEVGGVLADVAEGKAPEGRRMSLKKGKKLEDGINEAVKHIEAEVSAEVRSTVTQPDLDKFVPAAAQVFGEEYVRSTAKAPPRCQAPNCGLPPGHPGEHAGGGGGAPGGGAARGVGSSGGPPMHFADDPRHPAAAHTVAAKPYAGFADDGVAAAIGPTGGLVTGAVAPPMGKPAMTAVQAFQASNPGMSGPATPGGPGDAAERAAALPIVTKEALDHHVSRSSPVAVVHLMRAGQEACGTLGLPPDKWDANHSWAYPSEAKLVTCSWCRDVLKDEAVAAKQQRVPGT